MGENGTRHVCCCLVGKQNKITISLKQNFAQSRVCLLDTVAPHLRRHCNHSCTDVPKALKPWHSPSAHFPTCRWFCTRKDREEFELLWRQSLHLHRKHHIKHRLPRATLCMCRCATWISQDKKPWAHLHTRRERSEILDRCLDTGKMQSWNPGLHIPSHSNLHLVLYQVIHGVIIDK